MELKFLQHVYQSSGPFATVYLDTSADSEDAAKAIELRWRAAREQLHERGADESTTDAIGERVREHRRQSGPRGQVLVGAEGAVVFQDELPAPPTDVDEPVHLGALPHLMPYLQRRVERVPHAVAVVDHIGADIAVEHPGGETEAVEVNGDDHPVHKAHAGTPEKHQRFHMAVEERWKRNARIVAEELTKRARQVGARRILLGGDPQQRQLVRDQLGKDLQDRVIETESGLAERNASEEKLHQEMSEAIQRAHVEEAVDSFEHEHGARGRAVQGWPDTVEALRRAQVDTLLWTLGDSAGQLSVGPKPDELALDDRTVKDMGAESVQHVPASAAVVRSLAHNKAEVVLPDPGAAELADGIGAVLRYRS